MKPSRSKKRRRLVQSYVLPQGPDLPARFESLNDDTLTTVLEFLGGKSYRSFGGLTKHCKEVYLNTPGMTKETFLFGYAPLSAIIDKIERARYGLMRETVGKGVVCFNRRDVFEWALQQQKNSVLENTCDVAGKEGRIDLLEEVWNNVNDENHKRFIFEDVEYNAAGGGKLNVIKWLETKGLYLKWRENGELRINKRWCAIRAAEKGHIHIIQWLKEEKGLQLFGELYYFAIDGGGHFLILKWLREQACPWDDYIFKYAAVHGNLEILQWLHDEGCPWPDYVRVPEHDIKPENLTWLRVNGYGSRFM